MEEWRRQFEERCSDGCVRTTRSKKEVKNKGSIIWDGANYREISKGFDGNVQLCMCAQNAMAGSLQGFLDSGRPAMQPTTKTVKKIMAKKGIGAFLDQKVARIFRNA